MANVRLDNISKKVMYIQVGISTAKLRRVTCSRDYETVFQNHQNWKRICKDKGYMQKSVMVKTQDIHGLCGRAARTRPSNYYQYRAS